jgi:hypothetical protein
MPRRRLPKGPAFLCVGPERSGTSWLYQNLAPHPAVFLTPVTELRYFYELDAYPSEGWRSRLAAGGDWHTRDHRAYLRERFDYFRARPYRLLSEWRRLRWDCRYLFGRRSDAWDLSLFDQADDRLSGDISPQYFSLPEAGLRHMRELLPGARVLILLRDPVDWSWSFARMTLLGDRSPEEVPDAELIAFFEKYMRYYPTIGAIDRWLRHFPQERVFVGFHDRLRESPRAFYDEVCSFLGIDPEAAPPGVLAGLSRRVNQGRELPLPRRFAVHLARRWAGEIDRLCEAYSPYPQRWRERHTAMLLGEGSE